MNFDDLLKNSRQSDSSVHQLSTGNQVEQFLNVEHTGVSSLDGIDFDELLRSKADSIHSLNLDREEIVSRLEDPALLSHVQDARIIYISKLKEQKLRAVEEVLKNARVRFDKTRKFAGEFHTQFKSMEEKQRDAQDMILATRDTHADNVSSAKQFVNKYGQATVNNAIATAARETTETNTELKNALVLTYKVLENALLVVGAKVKTDDALKCALDDISTSSADLRQSARNLCQEYEHCIDSILDIMEEKSD